MGWCLDHLDDIESDLSAIHRIDDMWAMDGPRFHRFARRLPAYRGAMRAVAERQARDEERSKEQRGLSGMEITPIPAGTAVVSGAPAGLIDFG